jgi:hypothetical protein
MENAGSLDYLYSSALIVACIHCPNGKGIYGICAKAAYAFGLVSRGNGFAPRTGGPGNFDVVKVVVDGGGPGQCYRIRANGRSRKIGYIYIDPEI